MAQGMLLMAVLFILTLVLCGVGGYFFLRHMIRWVKKGHAVWESTADELKLTVDNSSGPKIKPMSGTRNGRMVTVEHITIPYSDGSNTDHHAMVEVHFTTPLALSFEIKTSEKLHKMLAGLIKRNDETGREAFDAVFKAVSSDDNALFELLNIEMLDGQSTTLMTDLMLARKKAYIIKINNTLIGLRIRAGLGDSKLIEPTIGEAMYLADRFEKATTISASKTAKLLPR